MQAGIQTYYKGYWEARMQALDMGRDDLLLLLDSLYGRENINEESPTTDEIRSEALRQLSREWETPEGRINREYLEGYAKVMRVLIG